MRNFKITIAIAILTCFVLSLAGCGYTREDRKLMKQYSKQAKTNAKNYIAEKYGIEADVIDTDVEKTASSGPIPEFFPSPTSMVYVEMKHDKKKFHVYITGEKASTDGYDNYQFDAIKNALMEHVKSKLKVEPVMCNLHYGKEQPNNDECHGLINEYYDGTNLKEVLSKMEFSSVFEYANDVDLESIHESNCLKDFLKSGRMLFVQYSSKEAYDKVSDHSYNILGTPQTDALHDNAPYIAKALLVDSIDEQYYKFDLNEYDGFYYHDFKDDAKVTFKKTSSTGSSLWENHKDDGLRCVSDTYSVESNADSVKIYFPASKINDMNKLKEIDVRISHKYKGMENHSVQNLSSYDKFGDYYVFDLHLKGYSDVNFVILGE